jgi:hypothetical protein
MALQRQVWTVSSVLAIVGDSQKVWNPAVRRRDSDEWHGCPLIP